MPPDRRTRCGLCVLGIQAVLMVTSAASAQSAPGSETLETPYGQAPVAPAPQPAAPQPAAPAAPPPPAPLAPQPPQAAPVAATPSAASPAMSPPDTRPRGPIRATRRLALTGEVGWNGIAGFGPVLTYYAVPKVAVDFGGGISLEGWKVGVRGRYNFVTGPVTPFLGAGFMATSGIKDIPYDPSEGPDGDPNRAPVTLNVEASYFIQGVIGVDYIHRGGFTLIGCLGYARLLNHDNVHVVEGELTKDEQRAVNAIFKSGPVITVGVGYAFQ